MKKIIISTFLALSFMQVQAQDVSNDTVNRADNQANAGEYIINKLLQDDDQNHAPEFPGGMEALYEFIVTHTQYPRHFRVKGKHTTYVNFTVNTDGSLTDIEIKKSSGYQLLDKEALRVLRKMPKWNPGIQNSKPVSVKLTFPFQFRLL